MFAGYRGNEDFHHPAAEMLQLLHEAGCNTQDEHDLQMGLTACHAALLVYKHMSRNPSNQPGHKARAGRNEPCPCGSGKKYKKCCLDADRMLSADDELWVKFGPEIVPRMWDVASLHKDLQSLGRIMDRDPAFANVGFSAEKVAAFMTSLDDQDPLFAGPRDEESRRSAIDDLAVRYLRQSGEQRVTRGIEDKLLAAAARARSPSDVRGLAAGVCLAMIAAAKKDPADDLIAIILFRKALRHALMSMRLLDKVMGGIDEDDVNRFIEGAADPALVEKISSAYDQLSASDQAFIEAEYDKHYDDLLDTIAAGEFPVPPPFATQLALLGRMTLAPSKKDMPDIVFAFSDGLLDDDYVVYGRMLDQWLVEHEGSSDRIAQAVTTMRQLCMIRSIGEVVPRLLVRCLQDKRWVAFDEEEEGFILMGSDHGNDLQAFVAEYGSWLRTKGYSAMADRLVRSWEGKLPDVGRRRVA
jgi:SEC-C motif